MGEGQFLLHRISSFFYLILSLPNNWLSLSLSPSLSLSLSFSLSLSPSLSLLIIVIIVLNRHKDGQLKVMFVGGPNVRKDFHIEAGAEACL